MTLATNPAGFSGVDDEPHAADLVDALDELASEPAVQRLRAAGVERLGVRRGQHLLDLGCGTGDTTRMLGRLVGSGGSVVGIERSRVMVDAALARTRPDDHVQFRIGDATKLEVSDATVDGVWCERVLQHLDEPEVAMREIARVVRPGGRAVVIDTDWEMHAIHGADPVLTRRILDCWCSSLANGRSGRALPARMLDSGFSDVSLTAETIISTDASRAARPPIILFARVAQHVGAITEAESHEWLRQLQCAADADRFCWALTMFAASSRR